MTNDLVPWESLHLVVEIIHLPQIQICLPLIFVGKRIKWLILPLHESETDRHLIGLSG